MGKLLSVSEYARLTSKDPGNIRRYCLSGRIPAIKVGNQWCIDSDTPYPKDKRVSAGSYKDWRKRYCKKAEG